jgi:hypothetical protein
MSATQLSMKGLPFTPFDAAWILESRAFLSDDPRIVRAVSRMLFYAWLAVPAASVPADAQRLANASGLTPEEVTEHWTELTDGWTMREGRLFHDEMSALCERIANRFPDLLELMGTQAAAMVQAPEDFELTAPTVESRTKGRRLLPRDWALTPQLRLWLKAQGIVDEQDQNFVTEKFITHFRRTNEKMNDWESAFKNFALKEDHRRLPSATRVVPLVGAGGAPGSRAERFGSAGRGEAAVNHNRDVLRGGVRAG